MVEWKGGIGHQTAPIARSEPRLRPAAKSRNLDEVSAGNSTNPGGPDYHRADVVGVPERSLAEILAHRVTTGVPIPVPLTLAILRQVCDALDWAHNLTDPHGRPLGIVHRDVSPAWIVVAENGAVRLLGSMALHPNAAYLAPEFIATGMLDSRADLFALGVVAHEMLANRPLFAGTSDADTIQRVFGLPIPSPSQFNPAVPPDVDSIVLMALARDPAYRWQYAAMMRDGLLSVMQRLSFDMGATQAQAWSDLFWGRVEQAHAPSVQFAAPASPTPPQPPPVVPSYAAPPEAIPQPQPPAPTPGPAPAPSPSPIVPPVPAPARDPGRRTPMPRLPTDPAIHEFMSTLDASSSQQDLPAPVLPTPPTPVDEPVLPSLPSMSDPPPSTGFELDIPEGTQIGAVPLVSFDVKTGTSPVFGDQKQRLARPSLPPPVAMVAARSNTQDDDDEPRSKRTLLLIVVLAVLVLGGGTMALFLFAL